MVPAVDPPHAGLKILELARILAGPWVGQTFADLGADVIKVESPVGDDTRQWGPPFVEYTDGGRDAAYFHACNRGKRSIALDFNDPVDRGTVLALAADADIVVENFRPGTLARYGLDYDSLRQVNPRLIYCSISGFGQTGPSAARAGYDFIAQGMGGIMHLTGEADGDPQKSGVAFADIFTGLYAVIGIQAALARRHRTGVGECLDMALLDSMVGVLANQGMNYLVGGTPPMRMGNAHPNIAPYQTFAAADGPFILAVGNDGQFRRFCQVVGLDMVADDPRYVDNAARVSHRATLAQEIARAVARWNKADLLARLEEAIVPSGPVYALDEVFADPQVQARAMVGHVSADTRSGDVPAIRTPLWMGDGPQFANRSAPRLDGDRDAILAGVAQIPSRAS